MSKGIHSIIAMQLAGLALLSVEAAAGPVIVVTTPVTTNLDDEDAVVLFDSGVEIRNESTVTTNGRSADGLRTSGIGARVTNTSTGVIVTTGDDFAVGIRTAGDEIHIENAGSITTSGINGDGIIVFGNGNDEGRLIPREPQDFVGNSVVNSGTVEVSGVGADGFVVEGDRTTLTNSGSIITNAGIRNGEDNGTGAFFAGFENQLNNSGLIESTGVDSTTVRIFDQSTIRNTGSIINSGDKTPESTDFAAGKAITMAQTSTLINSGNIDGDIAGSFGSQRVELRSGSSISGTVDVSLFDEFLGSPANDELVVHLDQDESLNVSGDQYIGFDAFQKSGAGTLQLSDSLILSETAQGRIEQGKLELNDGTLVLGDLLIESGGELAGNGSVFGDIFVQTGGVLGPGFSPGQVDVFGNLTVENGGILSVDFAGLGTGEFDFFNVSGIADLTGVIIDINFLEPFLPTALDSINFLSASSIIGLESAVFRTPGARGDLDFVVSNGILGFTALSDFTRVPAPTTIGLLVLGSLGLLRRARSKSGDRCCPASRIGQTLRGAARPQNAWTSSTGSPGLSVCTHSEAIRTPSTLPA
ncbi:MAG: hypothetical protein AAGI72_22070 [Pseudomonadota bacterium]